MRPTPARSFHRLTAAAIGATVALVPVAASAAPTCTTAGTEAACGGRVVAEPVNSTTFLQYGLEFPDVVAAIEAIAPDVVDARPLSGWLDDPTAVSAGGREVWVVRLTDESVPGPKKDVVASLSVHGNESAGREGGIRYAEDIARWWAAGDTEHPLHGGDTDVPLSQVLAETEIWLGFTNPDGWAAGDLATGSGGIFSRGNDTGADLNREYPTTGWTNMGATPLSEPEAVGWVRFLQGLDDLTTASDIHGELTTATNSWADMMWPAGQWSPRMQAQELQLAQNMTRTIQRKFDEDPVSPQTVLGQLHGTPADAMPVATQPSNFATAYDIVGYDDGGFMGDYFNKLGAVEIDVENFLSHTVPSNVWVGGFEQAHVIAVRGILEALAVEAILTDDVTPDLDIASVAYVANPRRVSDTDANGVGRTAGDPAYDAQQVSYDVSPLDYFDDLAADAGVDIPALSPAAIADGSADLSAFDSIVLVDEAMPAGSYDRDAYTTALRDYASAGGQLVLTDGAAGLLTSLGLFTDADLKTVKTNAGHVDFGAQDHPWEAGLTGVPSQTYYEVPLGFPAENSAPHFGVVQSAWEAAGGVTAGTVDAAARRRSPRSVSSPSARARWRCSARSCRSRSRPARTSTASTATA